MAPHDIYYAEQQITKALPKMIDQATNRELAQGLKNHRNQQSGPAAGPGVQETRPEAVRR
jgi:ferritin-like metal-binding protein YciE